MFPCLQIIQTRPVFKLEKNELRPAIPNMVWHCGSKSHDNLPPFPFGLVVDKGVRDMMGAPKIFTEEGVIKKEEIKNQVIVEGPGEVIKLDENERAALKLGPKFCMYNKLSDEECRGRVYTQNKMGFDGG